MKFRIRSPFSENGIEIKAEKINVAGVEIESIVTDEEIVGIVTRTICQISKDHLGFWLTSRDRDEPLAVMQHPHKGFEVLKRKEIKSVRFALEFQLIASAS